VLLFNKAVVVHNERNFQTALDTIVNMQESEILSEIIAGDTERFGLLYDAYAERIYNYHFYRIRDRATAEDLTSVTFFKAIKHIQSFDIRKGNFSSWLYRIARNTLIDHTKSTKQTSPIESAEHIGDGIDLEHEAINKELARKVRESFTQLSPEQRDVVTMRIWDDLSYPEIAAILGKSEGGCKMAFHRAIGKLKDAAPLALALIILFKK
jgi:RNA polymerase sigma-70 factor (ECF subfamily)